MANDKRFSRIRPQLVDHSPEPALYDIIVKYYTSNGIDPTKAAELAGEYIIEWQNLEQRFDD